MVIGNVEPDDPPGPLPADATMDTKDLHIGQAAFLSLKVLGDESKPKSERAVALCWLLHLVADGHQPLHAGSLYAPVFNVHDRGGNSIKLVGGGNLHAAWDRLLGSSATANDVRRRVAELGNVRDELQGQADDNGMQWCGPSQWLAESREAAQRYAYTDEVLTPVRAASRDGGKLEPIKLSDGYFERAGDVARERAKLAGYRLALLLSVAVQER